MVVTTFRWKPTRRDIDLASQRNFIGNLNTPSHNKKWFVHDKILALNLLKNHLYISFNVTPMPNGMPRYLVMVPCLISFHSFGIQGGRGMGHVIQNSVLCIACLEPEIVQNNSRVSRKLLKSLAVF